MKNSKFYLESRSEVVESMENLVNNAKAEGRDLSNDEQMEFDSLNEKAEALTSQAKRASNFEAIQAEKVKNTPLNTEEEKATRNWSLFKAINEIRNGGNLSGLEKEMHQEAEGEARKGLQGIGIPTWMTEKRAIDQGGSAIAPTSVGAFVDSLQANSLYNQVGINDLGTVAADTVLPIAGGSTTAWASEVATVTNSGADFDKITLTPKRLSAVANLSNVILAQNGPAAEASVMRDLGRNVGVQIDAAMFGSTNVPQAPGCIAATTGVLTFSEATSLDVAGDLLAAVQKIADNHGLDGNLQFVNSWELYSPIQKAALVSSVAPLFSDGMILGYKSNFSAAPAKNAGTSGDGLFGDFSRVYFATFGPTNILVDPYTNAADNEVRLVLNNHYDFAVASGASFVKYTTLSA